MTALIPLLSSNIFLFLFMSTSGLVLVPTTFQAYLKWKSTHKKKDFSSVILIGAISLLLLTSVFPLFVSQVIGTDAVLSSGIYRILVFLALTYLLGFLTLPKMLGYFEKLRETKKTSHFFWMILYGLMSFYLISVFFIVVLNLSITASR